MTNYHNLQPIEHLALSKVKLPDKVRDGLAPGAYPVDAVVRITGEVRVGEDHPQKGKLSVPWAQMLLSALAGLTTEERAEFVRVSMGTQEDYSELQIEIEDLVRSIAPPRTYMARGKTTAKLDVEALDKAVVIR